MEDLQLPFLGAGLNEELRTHGSIAEVPSGEQLMREGQYIKTLPIVLQGLVKVYTRFNDKELLLYYLQPDQSCVMTFQALLQNRPSRIFALTEEPTRMLLVPANRITRWLKKYPQWNTLFFAQYDLRYTDLIETIGSLLIDKMDQRVYGYLLKKIKLSGSHPIKLSHGEIASDLGTAREVVSRVIKKLEIEGRLVQGRRGIEIPGE